MTGLSKNGPPRILYLGVLDDTPVQDMKLAGVRRYAGARGWEVVTIPLADARPGRVQSLLRQFRPIGCIVECFGNVSPLKPTLFGRLPVVWMDFPSGLESLSGVDPRCGLSAVSVDEEAVARAALRELSATRPESFAAVEFRRTLGRVPSRWSRFRAETFRSLAAAEGRSCAIFEDRIGETQNARATRLADWLAARPRPCGVFAVNDGVASEIRDACRSARLHIPRHISILGVDNDTAFCEAADPTLSSIQMDFERAGYVSARMLAASFASPWRGGGETIVPLMVVRRKSTSGRGRHEPRILEAVEMIRREACDGLTAAALAARFPGSRRLFELRFREAMGHSVLDEILHVRLEKAFTLLAQTDTAIGAIADFCGFRSHWALDYLFRTRFKMSMSEWRKRNGRAGS